MPKVLGSSLTTISIIQQKSKAEENKSIFVKNRNMIHISA